MKNKKYKLDMKVYFNTGNDLKMQEKDKFILHPSVCRIREEKIFRNRDPG
jgi:hypothetical protein